MIESIINLFKTNPLFAGLFGAMISGSVLYLCKSLPLKLLNLLIKHLTVTIIINNDDPVFSWIDEYLSKSQFSLKARILKLFTKKTNLNFAPGYGEHLFVWKGTIVKVSRLEQNNTGTVSWTKKEQFILTTFGRSQDKLREFISAAKRNIEEQNEINIYVANDLAWVYATSRTKKSLDSICLPKDLKTDLINDINWFSQNKPWYTERGIPYHRGYIFYGPPGTGKSSLAFSIASMLNKSVYLLSLDSVKNDNALTSLMNHIPKGSVVLIEDIDSFRISKERVRSTEPSSKEENYTSLSLSGLLNALDGVSSPDDCIIIMTSNHIDRIDAALIRPGRIDRKFLIDLMETEQVLEMFKNFFPGEHKELTVLRSYIDRVKLAPAEWQALFLDNKDNFDLLISKVEEKSMPGKNNNTHNELPISWMGT